VPVDPTTLRRLEHSPEGQLVLGRLIDQDPNEPGIQWAAFRDRGTLRSTDAARTGPSNDPLTALVSALGATGILLGVGGLAMLVVALALTRPRRSGTAA
jgi:hypothetical protein